MHMRPLRLPVSASIWRDQGGSAMAEYAVLASLLAAIASVLMASLGGELAGLAKAIREGLAALRAGHVGRP
jgi:Flp pilus assembly pilin Flp